MIEIDHRCPRPDIDRVDLGKEEVCLASGWERFNWTQEFARVPRAALQTVRARHCRSDGRNVRSIGRAIVAAGRMLVRPHDGGIDDQVFWIFA
jgi:hypothetical protein